MSASAAASPSPVASPEGLLEIGDRIAGWAKGSEQIEAVIAIESETEVRAYAGEVEAFSSAKSMGAGIRVISDQRQGFAYAGTLDETILAETLEEARDNVKFATPDEYLGLAEPDGVDYVSLDLYNDSVTSYTPEQKIQLALDLEQAVLSGDSRIIGVESADYSESVSLGAIVTTSGIRYAQADSSCYISAYSLAQADGDTQTGFGYSISRDPDELDVATAAADAVDRATRLLGAVKPASQRTKVLLDPWVTAQLLGIIGATLSGEAVIKGRSLFANRLEELIANRNITLVDDPTNPTAFTAGEADGEGLATRRNVLIDSGRLKKFVHNSYTARRLHTTSTASAVRGVSSTPTAGCQALQLLPGKRSQEELCAAAGDAVLVQSVAGLHSGVNPVSGDFSTGAEGLRIQAGAPSEPLKEFTIASTIQRLLQNVSEVGNDLEWLPMRAAGVSLLIDDVMVSGD